MNLWSVGWPRGNWPDEQGSVASDLMHRVEALGPSNIELANHLQRVHDLHPVSQWKQKLIEAADLFTLRPDVLEVSDG